MKLVRLSPVFSTLALALTLFIPMAAHADGFGSAIAVPGWKFVRSLGNTDSDPASEMLMVNRELGYHAIFDGITGALEFPFYAVKEGTSLIQTVDYEGDGRFELVILSEDGGGLRFFGVWHYVAGSYDPYFSHSDSISSFNLAHLRSAATLDLIEVRSDDVLVRDVTTGTVIWRASLNFPGWSPANPFAFVEDLDRDGRSDLMVCDFTTSLRAYKYNAGAFQPLWSRAGGWNLDVSFNSDADPQAEIALIGASPTLPGACLVLDGLTGVSEINLTSFTGFSRILSTDSNGDGRSEIYVSQFFPNMTSAYEWNGSSHALKFTFTDSTANPVTMAPMRFANQGDYIEELPFDLRLRDSAGNLFFRASTMLPGFNSGGGIEVNVHDIDHDGVNELLISNGGNTWMVQYRAGTMQPVWSTPGISPLLFVGNTDGDAQDEFLSFGLADQSYRLFDGLLGTQAAHWPQYTVNDSYIDYGVWEQSGRTSLLFSSNIFGFPLPPSPQPTRVYRWDGSGYSAQITIHDSLASVSAVQHRDASHWELLAYGANGDVWLRDAADGRVLFQASSALPGWTGLDFGADPRSSVFTYDPRGARETAINSTTGMHVIRRAVGLDAPPSSQPRSLRLLPSTPNPFRSATTLRFEAPRATQAALRIHDPAGRLLRSMDLALVAGLNTVAWDGKDDAGRIVPEGLLFYELRVDGSRESMKLVRLR